MLQQILQIIIQEDTFKLFTSSERPSVFEVLSKIQDPTNLIEIKTIIFSFFGILVNNQDPNSFLYSEAFRIMNILEKKFLEFQECMALKMNLSSTRPERDFKDDVIDLYMESLDYFINGLEEPVLIEHYKYLER